MPSLNNGKYKYSFVDPFPLSLTCRICSLPCREAHKSQCCGDMFCKSCVTNVSHSCPTCFIERLVCVYDSQADCRIKIQDIYCPNKECSWIGKLDDVDKHIHNSRSSCFIKCNRCKSDICYCDVTKHNARDCPCYCTYCDTTTEEHIISRCHKEKCHMILVPCPNHCGTYCRRGHMNDHLNTCPFNNTVAEGSQIHWLSYQNIKKRLYHIWSKCTHEQVVFQNITAILCVVVVFLVFKLQFHTSETDKVVKQMTDLLQSKFNTEINASTLWPLYLDHFNEMSSHGDQVAPVVLKISDFMASTSEFLIRIQCLLQIHLSLLTI